LNKRFECISYCRGSRQLSNFRLTAEDNRDEDIYEICQDIQEFIEKPVSVIIEDRRIAIEQAIEIANKGDIILILGKGHEQFMASSIGNEPYPGDKYVALEAIKKIFENQDDDIY